MAAETAWARAFLDALQPHRAGVYVNFLDLNFLDSDDDTSRVCEAYGDDTYQRLAEGENQIRPRPAPVVSPISGTAPQPAVQRRLRHSARPASPSDHEVALPDAAPDPLGGTAGDIRL